MKYMSSNTRIVYEQSFDTDRKKRYECPECSPNRKKSKSKDLEFYPESKSAYCFHCSTSFHEYNPYTSEKKYKVPEWQNKTELTDKAVKWFNSRMISQQTLVKAQIYSDVEFMPQFNKNVEVICFPFFRNGKIVNIKYRGANKSFKLVSNAELVWFNFDAILSHSEVIICEGEIDALSFIENGYNNVISVPNGAKSTNDYLDNSISLFDKVDRIIISNDNDSAGLGLRDELIRRFGAERCSTLNFRECKDANEFFCKYGGMEFKNVVDNPIPVPIAGNIELRTMYSEIVDLYENGVQEGLRVGIDNIDQFCTWELGRIVTVTGRPGSGKSEFVDFLISRLNVLYGWKAAYFTPENYPLKYHYAKIHEKLTGGYFKKGSNNCNFDTVFEYVQDNYFYILNEDDLTIDSILRSANAFIKSKGIKILVIDPYNKLDHQVGKHESETQYISKFLDKLINFTRFNNLLTFLIAHPTKMPKGEVPSLYNISGSAHFYNKTDYGFTVDRCTDSESNLMNDNVIVYWQKIKFKHLGRQGISELTYNKTNGRFYPISGLDNEPWLNNVKDVSDKFEPNINFWDEPPSNDVPF